jgi:hypothetical protein
MGNVEELVVKQECSMKPRAYLLLLCSIKNILTSGPDLDCSILASPQ